MIQRQYPLPPPMIPQRSSPIPWIRSSPSGSDSLQWIDSLQIFPPSFHLSSQGLTVPRPRNFEATMPRLRSTPLTRLVARSFALARELSGSNIYRATRQVFTNGDIPNECKRGTLSVMRALAHDSGQVPPRYQIEPHTLSVEGNTIDGGGSSDVRKGRLGDKIVAVKTLKSRNIDAQKVCNAPKYFFGMC